MSVKVAEGVVVVKADAKDVAKEVAREIDRGQDDVNRSGRRVGDGWVNSFKGSFLGNALADIAGNVVNFVGQAISTGVSAAWDLAWDSIDIASGLQEADTALESIFGGAKGSIDAFAEGAASNIGQSELAAKKAAQTFGIYGQAAGLANKANATFSTDLVSLASDFASFYDTSPEQAIEAIGSALRGEAEPLRAYGVLLDDARLRQEAMELGIYDGNGALDSQQRILAANRAIFEDAGVAIGDYEKTSGGLANQQRELAAAFEDAKGKLGEALLPVLTELITVANDTLIPVLDDVIDKVGPALADALEEGGPLLIGFIEDLAPRIPELVDGLVGFTEWLADPQTQQGMEDWGGILEGLGGIVEDVGTGFMDTAGLIGIAAGIVNGQSFDDIVERLNELPGFWGDVWGAARDTASNVGASVGTMIYNVRQFAYDVGSNVRTAAGEFGRFAGDVGANIGRAVTFVAELPGRAAAALGDLGRRLFSQGQSLVRGFVDGITSSFRWIGDAVGSVVNYVAGFFPNSPAKRGPLSGAGWTRLKMSGSAVMRQFADGMNESKPAVPFELMGLGGAATRPVGGDYGGRSQSTVPRLSAPLIGGDIHIYEATDPLGTEGRVAAELRRWAPKG